MGKQKIAQRVSLKAAVAGVILSSAGVSGLQAATIYYDTNNATAGTGATALDWNSSATAWNFDPAGGTAAVNSVGGTGTQAWASGAVPGNLDGSDVVFSASATGGLPPANYNINDGGNKTANSITVAAGGVTLRFASSTATSANRFIGAGGILLSGTDSPAAPLNFQGPTTGGNFNVVVTANQTWTNNSGATSGVSFAPAPVPGTGTLNLSTNAASGTTLLTLAGSAAGAYNFGALVYDGTTGGKVGITTAKNTNFTNVVSTFSGGLTITGGNTLLDNGGGLGHSSIALTGGSLAAGLTGTGGSLTDNLAGDTGELITLSGASLLTLTNINFTLAATGTQTLAEYVLANKGVGSANIAGTTFATANLPSGWSIDYDGTVAHPGNIVLLNGNVGTPEPAALGLLSLGGLLLGRRRRA